MNKPVLIISFLIVSTASFAQKGKDPIVYNLPMVNDRLVYKGSIFAK